MKSFSRIFLVAGASTFAAIVLPSCVTYPDYSQSRGESRPLARTSTFGSAQPWQYRDGRGFDPYHRTGGGLYRDDYRYDRRHDQRDHHFAHDHRDHERDSRSSGSNTDLKHRPGTYQIVGGSTGSKTKPKGFHSVSWYKSRGYDVDKLKLRDEEGEYYRKKKR